MCAILLLFHSYPITAAVTMDVVFLTLAAAFSFPVSTGMLGKCVAIRLAMREHAGTPRPMFRINQCGK